LWFAKLREQILCHLSMLALIYLSVLAQVRSCPKFDLILSVIPSVCVASSCSLYFCMFYSVLLASSKLIGT
jgi:hypothetical protein